MVSSNVTSLDVRLAGAHSARFWLAATVPALGFAVFERTAPWPAVFGAVLLAVGLQYTFAVAAFWAVDTRGAYRRFAFALAIGTVLLIPLIVPADARLSRLLVAIFGIGMTCRLVDLASLASAGAAPPFRSYLGVLPNLSIFVMRRAPAVSTLPRQMHLRALARNGAQLAIAALIMAAAAQVEWSGSFLLEHTVKATAFFLAATSMVSMLVALIRLAGLPARDFGDAPFRSDTPADFWRRYNRFMGQFLHEFVFKRFGGFRAPVVATVMVFMVSGLMHEYIVTVATGRVQGYQMAFFVVHALAVSATLKLRPRGTMLPLAIALTFAFNLFTSILFFGSMHEIVPIYHQPLPAWLW